MSINNLFSLLICSNQHDHQSKSLRSFVGSLDFHPFPIFSSIQNRFIHSKFSHIFASLPEISCLCPLVSVRSPPILEAPNSISFHFIFIFADITSQSHGLPVWGLPPTFATVKFYANISDCAGAVNLAKGDVKTGIMPVTKLARLQHKIKFRVFSTGDLYCKKMFMIRVVQKVTCDHDYNEDF